MSITCIARTQPIEYPEYPKFVEPHFFQMSETDFAFEDETAFLMGGYVSLVEAKAAYLSYFDWLNQHAEGYAP